MTFTGAENQYITLTEAAVLTKNYRDAQSSDNYIKAEYFSAAAISGMLVQTGCVGIRVYHAIKIEGGVHKPSLVICGVDTNGNDLIDGNITDNGMICPPMCSVSNPLNSDPTVAS